MLPGALDLIPMIRFLLFQSVFSCIIYCRPLAANPIQRFLRFPPSVFFSLVVDFLTLLKSSIFLSKGAASAFLLIEVLEIALHHPTDVPPSYLTRQSYRQVFDRVQKTVQFGKRQYC